MSKNKPNAFLFFMLEWKKKQEARGEAFPGGLKDVQNNPDCNAAWRSLSEYEKAKYKDMAKNGTKRPTKKKTATGEYVDDVERARIAEKEFKYNMREYIKDLINTKKNLDALADIKFYLIHINYFYFRTLENNEMEYYPAEISIGQFSLNNGLQNVYHQIINEKIKLGFRCSAQEQSNRVHQIPPEGAIGKSDYCEIFNDICRFLEPGKINGKYPPLYTLRDVEDVHAPVKSVLSRFSFKSKGVEDFFTIYSFEEFFTIMHNAMDKHDTTQPLEAVIALIELKKDPYGYKKGLGCDYHESISGSLSCSLSIIKRWFFTLTNFCCKPLEINMIPGIHMPQENDNDDTNNLSFSFSSLNLTNSKLADSTMTLSELSSDYRKRASHLRPDCQRQKVEAPKLNPYNKDPREPIIERPLRPPLTKSAVMNFDSTDTESIDFSERSFPSIGRGGIKKRPFTHPKPVKKESEFS